MNPPPHLQALNVMKIQKRFNQLLTQSGLIVGLTFTALSLGCSHFPDKESQLNWTGKPSLHQIRSSELREKMRAMNALMFEYELDELRYDEQRSRQAARIAEIAGSMSVLINSTSTRRKLGLDTEHIPVFSSLAKRLKKQALELNKAAQQGQAESYSRLYRAMVKTCTECHSKFRGRS